MNHQEDPAHTNVIRVFSLMSIAHKYEVISLENWAVALLRKHWMSAFGPQGKTSYQSQWTLDLMVHLTLLSKKTDSIDTEFQKAIESQWLSSFIADPEGFADIQKVLDIADSGSLHQQKIT